MIDSEGESDEGGVAEESDAESMKKSRRNPDPLREGLVIQQSIWPDQPAKYRGKDLLQCPGPKVLHILAEKQLAEMSV